MRAIYIFKTAAHINKKRLECTGYLVRMDHGREHESKLEGRWQMGRPIYRGLDDDDENDISEMDIKRW